MVPGSIRETVPFRLLATQTAWFPVVIPLGLLPTGIVWTTIFFTGSIRDTLSPSALLAGSSENEGPRAPSRAGMLPTRVDERQLPGPVPFFACSQISVAPGGSATSRSRRAWFSRRWRGSACRRFAARGAVWRGADVSEMVSCAGLRRGNERTLGYLGISPDERPLAVQIFGSDPGVMADAARDGRGRRRRHVDVNFGCPCGR